ncbi:hypothetical protein I7X12_16425 [Halosimplex litoreum]|uniref:Uncharacterized protein n=1 Tax=Halosimplex litoreum TaxID=1198301 RepID=A0A7T3KUI1_9EURY|nr:hypothetical protein [Halosimplex litoreum]QPV62309.1 hypothetical protein I7X12_16425 [Halosimplex litoreum]
MSYREPRAATLLVALGAAFAVWASVGSWAMTPLAVPAEMALNPNVGKLAYLAAVALTVALRGWGGETDSLVFAAGAWLGFLAVGPPVVMLGHGPLKLLFGSLCLFAAGVLGRWGDPALRARDAVPGWPSPPADGWVAFGGYLLAALGWVPLGPAAVTALRHPEKGLLLALLVLPGVAFCCYWWGPGLRVAFGFVGAALLFAALLPRGSEMDDTTSRLVRGFARGGAVFVALASAELLRRAVGAVRSPSGTG